MTFRSITSVQIIVAHGIELGIDENVLLQGSGLTSAQLADHERLIEDKQELQVLNNLMLTTQCPVKVGMQLGCRYHLTSYGIMGYALLASSTARKAIEFGLRYLDLTYVFSQITLTELNDDLSLRFSCDIAGKLGELVLVRDMLGAAMIQREVFERNGLPIKLQFMSPQPVGLCLEDIKQKLGAEIQFNANYNGFSGLAPLLDLPLVKANEATARLCEAQCSQLLQQKQNWKPVAKLVKDTLVHLGLTASMEDIAQHLARTTRTLHRQLKLEQTSWRQVRDDVRFGIAEELLLKPMQLDEIAERLGFSDGANFSHSFKRCKNITPSQYRKKATKQR
ncbi:AraC family transcriptional regulator [Shewanella vesiculosa]|uniref:AraC family transcriptional regulator n=1 Tax=Shewanella vesiculosa TaxID=518738 RepID=UPI000F4FF8B4|nr:AraC family transcriptional regulator [Shewanella vesiculosa]RPA56180.1 AraC family transcriptional regulator [Shewanella vesiculosa]UJL42335.1 AraC family transcriptional regulator ligand-binding domain-containing protein [Shewanella vesiculosa]